MIYDLERELRSQSYIIYGVDRRFFSFWENPSILLIPCAKYTLILTRLPFPSTYYFHGIVENSAADARTCSQLLNDGSESGKDIKMPPLFWMNTYRLARSLHFSNADDAEVHRPLRLIEQQMEESGEYGSMVAKMREQLNYYLRMPPKNKTFEPSLLCASFQKPYVEYYNFGMFCFILYKYAAVWQMIILTDPLFFDRPRCIWISSGIRAAMLNLSFLMNWMMRNFLLFRFS